jgi:TolA-binding protein
LTPKSKFIYYYFSIGETVKQFFIFSLAFLVASISLAGCGSTRELEESIAEKQATIGTLQQENRSLQTENGRLKGRVRELEQSLDDANNRASRLETRLKELQSQLEKMKSPAEPSDLDGAYRDALQKFMEGKYEDAINGFSRLLTAGIPDPLNDNCVYWIGESNFGLKRYAEAIKNFEGVIAFEWSNKKDDAQIMIARSFARSGDPARAKEEYQKLVDVYPASPYRERALQRIGIL